MPDAALSALVMNSFNPPSGTPNPHPTPSLQTLLHRRRDYKALHGLACAPRNPFLNSSPITFPIPPHHPLASLLLFFSPPQGLCTGCSLCLENSAPGCPYAWLFFILQGSAQVPLSQRGSPSPSYPRTNQSLSHHLSSHFFLVPSTLSVIIALTSLPAYFFSVSPAVSPKRAEML